MPIATPNYELCIWPMSLSRGFHSLFFKINLFEQLTEFKETCLWVCYKHDIKEMEVQGVEEGNRTSMPCACRELSRTSLCSIIWKLSELWQLYRNVIELNKHLGLILLDQGKKQRTCPDFSWPLCLAFFTVRHGAGPLLEVGLGWGMGV